MDSSRPVGGGLRVLLIDDNEDVRDVVSLQLETYFVVDGVESVASAVARISEGHRYDAVLCDVKMPDEGADGWLAACRSLDPRLAERTLFMTGGPTTRQAAALLASCRDRVLVKPVDVPDLCLAITRAAMR